MSLLTIVNSACSMMALPAPSSVFGNTSDDTAKLLLQLAQEEGRSLAARHNWQIITAEKIFTTVATPAQTSSIPPDFDRMIPETMFNRTRRRAVFGPVSSTEWQSYQSGQITFSDPVFRIRLGTIYIYPTPAAGETVAYEYIKDEWAETVDGNGTSEWTADADVGRLSESLMALGLVWRFKQSRGMEFQADYQIYEQRVRDAIVRDGSRPRLSSDPSPSSHGTRRQHGDYSVRVT